MWAIIFYDQGHSDYQCLSGYTVRSPWCSPLHPSLGQPLSLETPQGFNLSFLLSSWMNIMVHLWLCPSLKLVANTWDTPWKWTPERAKREETGACELDSELEPILGLDWKPKTQLAWKEPVALKVIFAYVTYFLLLHVRKHLLQNNHRKQ